LSGREGFGFLSAGFGAFVEMKHIFSIAPKVKKRRRTKVTGMTGRWTGRGLSMTGRVQSVQHSSQARGR
jgi:hypothetical protein